MGQIYTAQFNGVAVTAQQDFFEIAAPSSKTVLIHQVLIAQSTDFGDAQEEGLSILIKRGATTTGSGGSTVTTLPGTEPGFATAGSTVKANNTTKATAGTIVTIHADVWNVRGQFLFLPTPELRPVISGASGANRLTVELGTTPADSLTVNGTLYFEEIG